MSCHWRGCYSRYHLQGEAGKQEVMSILQKNNMTSDNNLCLLHMARYIYQTFQPMASFWGKDQEERILEIIRSHRLYEHAKACMPDGMTQMDDLWSSLALMLVLSDGVEELWQLMVSLQNSLNPEQLSEFLWCCATLLRAMADAGVKISNRLHHNVFSVLHRMENIPRSTNSEADQESESQMTREQQQILSHNIEREHVVKIIGFAGAGKTTTLVSYVQQRPQLRFLYVVFTKAAQMQAERIFPSRVLCKTMHSLAYGAVGQRYRGKLALSSLNPLSVFKVMPEDERSFVGARVVAETISNFWASTDPKIDAQHMPPHHDKTQTFLNLAKRIWKRMKKERPTSELAYHMYHDGYVKLWQLEGAQMMESYDVILIDEASDFTPVMMEILLSQDCAKILVGDPHQQIYSFRGAVDNMTRVEHTHIYYLTKSFRFGPEIAYVAATILEVGKNEKNTLVGGNQRDSVRGQDNEMWCRFQTGVGGADGKLAVLSRTNASVFYEAVRLTDLNPTSPIYIIGGMEAFGLSKIQDIWNLKYGGPNPRIKNNFIQEISVLVEGYEGLCQYAKETEDWDLLWRIDVVEKYGEHLPELIECISMRETDQQAADFILSTVHKAKGLGFDTVVLMDDFKEVSLQGNPSSVEDDYNLIYIAVTRAKRNLFMNGTVKEMLACAGEYFLRSEVTTMSAESAASRCSSPGCTNHITNPRHCMHRLPIIYVNVVERGGAVCLSCLTNMAGHLAFLMSPGIKQIPFP